MYWATRLFNMGLICCFLAACGSASGARDKPESLTGGLRGNRLFILLLPTTSEGDFETIEVYTDKLVTRGPIQATDPGTFTQVLLPDSLFTDLDILRQQWCTHPPEHLAPTNTLEAYRVAVQCNRILNPEYTLQLQDLPSALRSLIHFVSPAS